MPMRKPMLSFLVMGMLLVSCGVFLQCQVQNTCTPTNTSLCICPDQQQGTRTCREDGIFGPCVCPAPKTEQTAIEQSQEPATTECSPSPDGLCAKEATTPEVAQEPPDSESGKVEPSLESTSQEKVEDGGPAEVSGDAGPQETEPAEAILDKDCNEVCQGGTLCVGGVCKCPTGQTLCEGRCADLNTDVEHCGACGTTCGGNTSACIQGKCQCFFSNNKYSLTGNLGGGVGVMRFSTDGKLLVVASTQRQVTAFQTGGSYPLSFQFADKSGMDNASGISFGKNPDLFLLTGGYKYPYTFSITKKGREGSPLYTGTTGVSGARSPTDDRWAVVTVGDVASTPPKSPELWAMGEPGVSNGKKVIPGLPAVPSRLLYHPDGERLFISFRDGQILVWKNTDWKQHAQMKQNANPLRSMALSKDGLLLAAGSNDNAIHLWDAATYKYLRSFSYSSTYQYDVNDVNFSPDGKWLVSAHDDGTVRIWEVSSGKQIHLLPGHRLTASSALFSPDGKDILTAGNEAKVLVWTCR